MNKKPSKPNSTQRVTLEPQATRVNVNERLLPSDSAMPSSVPLAIENKR